MKRLVASRKLKRKCRRCQTGFKKGDVYYKYRIVFAYGNTVEAVETLECPRCDYKKRMSLVRFRNFIKNCNHPIGDEVWSLMAGEDVVMEPSHYECRICGSHI